MTMFLRLYREMEPTGGTGGAAGEPPVAAPAAGVSTAPASVSTSMALPPAGTGGEPKAPETPSFVIPEAYKDKPYLKGVDSIDKVYKMLDGAQELIGKRPAGIPAADASPEEKAKFYEALGRPKAATEYAFDGADKADPKFLPKLQEAFHKHNLTQEQAKGVFADVSSVLQELAKTNSDAAVQADADFDKLADQQFGTNRDKVLSNAKGLLDKFTSPTMKDHLGKLSNENLIIMADVLNNISSKYIKESSAPGGQPPATGSSPTELRAKAQELMQSKEYNDPFHANHDKVVKQVQELYKQAVPR